VLLSLIAVSVVLAGWALGARVSSDGGSPPRSWSCSTTSDLLSAVMWFVFGAASVLALAAGVSWPMVLFCLLALTVVRLVPVLSAMLGSKFSWPERLLLGWLVAVLGSVVLHGVGAPAAAHAYGRAAN
jgi:NhaP-type Na+/H+ or K+/H+ antiporter